MRPTGDDTCERCGVEYREVMRYRFVLRQRRECRVVGGRWPGRLLAERHRWNDPPRKRVNR